MEGGPEDTRRHPPGADATPEPPRYTARLLIGCPDRPGIVAGVSGFLFERGANIVSSHQYSSDPSGDFLQRVGMPAINITTRSCPRSRVPIRTAGRASGGAS